MGKVKDRSRKLGLSDLQEKRKALKEKVRDANYVKVGMSTCGLAAGAQDTYNAFKEEIEKRGLDVKLKKCGCLGMCFAEPLVEVAVEGLPTVIYGKVNVSVAHRIIDEHLCGKRIVNDHVYEVHIKE